MTAVLTVPSTVILGAEFTIEASGVEGTHARVSVTYEHRAEVYKVSVAQESTPDYEPGVVVLTARAEEVGVAHVILWDWLQRNALAEADVTVSDD